MIHRQGFPVRAAIKGGSAFLRSRLPLLNKKISFISAPVIDYRGLHVWAAAKRARPRKQDDDPGRSVDPSSSIEKPPVAALQPVHEEESSADLPSAEDLQSVSVRERPQVVKAMEGIDKWLVFSDLHVHRRTLPTCMQVLDTVQREADRRGAGVIFLGDFWHLRGSLPVNILNAVLRNVRDWEMPVVLLPGNHDQISESGDEHSLTPLGLVLRQGVVVDRPERILDALWIPYRRREEEIVQAVQANQDASAIFCHVDIVGAQMNDQMQASLGLSASIFPTGVPVYTGHYHKPHIVPNTTIRYVGSPYQVSRSEAGQSKALLVLDKSWAISDTVPLDVGPRHFTIFGGGKLPSDIRAGDRVDFRVVDPEDVSVKTFEAELKALGLEVSVLAEPVQKSPARIAEAESLNPVRVLEQYAEIKKMDPQALELGRQILTEVSVENPSMAPPQINLLLHKVTIEGFGPYQERVEYPLSSRGVVMLTAKNYDDRSCVSNAAGKTTLAMAPLWALTGASDARPEGNSMRGLEKELLNDRLPPKSVAEVALEGVVNSKPFRVVRRIGGSRPLEFEFDGEDRTCQEVGKTQQRIDEELGDSRLLTRTVFHGQHVTSVLLDGTDKAVKEELALVISTDLWEKSRQSASSMLSKANQELQDADKAQSSQKQLALEREKDLELMQERVAKWDAEHRAKVEEGQTGLKESAEATAQALKITEVSSLSREEVDKRMKFALEELQRRAAELTAKIEAHRNEPSEHVSAAQTKLVQCESALLTAKEAYSEAQKNVISDMKSLERLQAACSSVVSLREELLALAPEGLSPLEGRVAELDRLATELTTPSSEEVALQQEVEAKKEVAETLRTEMDKQKGKVGELKKNIRTVDSTSDGAVCPHCLQPVNESLRDEHLKEMKLSLQREMQTLEALEKQVQCADVELKAARSALEAAKEARIKRREDTVRSHQKAKGVRDQASSKAWDLATQLSTLLQRLESAGLVLEPQLATVGYRPGTGSTHLAVPSANPRATSGSVLEDTEHVPEVALRIAKEMHARTEEKQQEAQQLQTVAEESLAAARLELDAAKAGKEIMGSQLQRELDEARSAADSARGLYKEYASRVKKLVQLEAEVNAFKDDEARLHLKLKEHRDLAKEQQKVLDTLSKHVALLKELESGFGRQGVQSFVLESGLNDLELRASTYLEVLSDGSLRMEIRATTPLKSATKKAKAAEARAAKKGKGRPKASGKRKGKAVEASGEGSGAEILVTEAGEEGSPEEEDEASGDGAGFTSSALVASERISKKIAVRQADGTYVERSVRQLSGGQRRRLGLALTLAFADFCASRTGISSNMIVFDEVLQHLDHEGRLRAGQVMKTLGRDTVLVISQDDELASMFDRVDCVVKQNDVSTILVSS